MLIARLAGVLHPRLLFPAGAFAALDPTLVVTSGVVLTDSLFVFGCVISLFAACRWTQRPQWRLALLMGLGLGMAALTRAMIAPWAVILLIALGGAAFRGHRQPRTVLAQLAAAAGLCALLLSPVLARNLTEHGTLQLTPQLGTHYLYWVVPLVMEAKDGTPRSQTAEAMRGRFEPGFTEAELNDPFLKSRALARAAIQALSELGPVAVVKAWAIGAAINLFSPAITIVPIVAQLPRTAFYETQGETKLEKIWHFLINNDNPLYGRLLMVGTIGVILLRLVQLYGLIAAFQLEGPARYGLFLLLGWALFVLLVNGPVASPKYRLPLEPVFAVLFAIGFDRFRRRRHRHSTSIFRLA